MKSNFCNLLCLTVCWNRICNRTDFALRKSRRNERIVDRYVLRLLNIHIARSVRANAADDKGAYAAADAIDGFAAEPGGLTFGN